MMYGQKNIKFNKTIRPMIAAECCFLSVFAKFRKETIT